MATMASKEVVLEKSNIGYHYSRLIGSRMYTQAYVNNLKALAEANGNSGGSKRMAADSASTPRKGTKKRG